MFVSCNNSLFYIIANHVANDNLFSSTSHLVSLLFSSSLPSISASLSFKKTQKCPAIHNHTQTCRKISINEQRWRATSVCSRQRSFIFKATWHFPLFVFLDFLRQTKDKEISRWHWNVIDGVSETGDFRLVVNRWFVKPSSVGDVRNKKTKKQ